jgi:hypothetical protein
MWDWLSQAFGQGSQNAVANGADMTYGGGGLSSLFGPQGAPVGAESAGTGGVQGQVRAPMAQGANGAAAIDPKYMAAIQSLMMGGMQQPVQHPGAAIAPRGGQVQLNVTTPQYTQAPQHRGGFASALGR